MLLGTYVYVKAGHIHPLNLLWKGEFKPLVLSVGRFNDHLISSWNELAPSLGDGADHLQGSLWLSANA